MDAPEYNFPQMEGTGLKSLISGVSKECLELLEEMLIYDPDFRF